MQEEVNSISKALELLELPPFITKDDVKKQYKLLARKYHPDINSDNCEKMNQINTAYNLIIEYIDNFRYSFDEDELTKQIPNRTHNSNFKPFS
jgi:DnaJ-class molecular chaperone